MCSKTAGELDFSGKRVLRMGAVSTIALSIVFGLALLLIILGLVYHLTRKKLTRAITERFEQGAILGATTRANFFGLKSKGGAQARGNGALVLTKDSVFFIRAVPQKEFEIPIASILEVSMPMAFNGRSVARPLLCLRYRRDSGEDAIAWSLKDSGKWKTAIQNMMA